MGRSQDHEYLAPYTLLARYYDALLSYEDGYEVWIKALKKYTKGKKVLDLASGSALFSKAMEEEGYEVVASDLSKEMKEAAKANFKGEYQIMDMSAFFLDRSFDIVTAVCDSVNYLDEKAFRSFLKCSYQVLEKGGYIFFDMHDLARLKEFKEPYIEEGHILDADYIWTIEADETIGELYEHFSFYIKGKEYMEDHRQFVYPVARVLRLMQEAGFKARSIDDFILNEKVLMIGVKE